MSQSFLDEGQYYNKENDHSDIRSDTGNNNILKAKNK